MEPELSRLSTLIQQEKRRMSLVAEQSARKSPIFQQPRGSVSPRTDSLSVNDALTEMQRRKMSVRSIRRKSINPRLDPPPGLEGLTDKGFVYVRQQMETDLRGENTHYYIEIFRYLMM